LNKAASLLASRSDKKKNLNAVQDFSVGLPSFRITAGNPAEVIKRKT